MEEVQTALWKQLVEAARKGMDCAYGVSPGVPRYGAAVLTTNGNIYASGQYRAETRQISIHAEQAALIHAAAHGEHSIRAIAIISDEDPTGDSFTNPCGICKQALYESSLVSGIPMQVVLAKLAGQYEVKPLEEFIVFPWPAPKK